MTRQSHPHHRQPAVRPRPWWLALCALSCVAVAADQAITIDGTRTGRRFDGIGAVSGGGATSRQLSEYPEPQRSQILDYLFLPDFGAALQVLYVEVGSDRNGTQGSEPSHARTREEFEHPEPGHFQRGYEWWLMEEAKKRNPRIRFDAAAWNAPGWVGADGRGGFWSQDMCDYYAQWLTAAKTYHGLDIRTIGCRNESGVNLPWIKLFRATLDRAGLQDVLIHGFDNWRPESKWLFAKELAGDAELRAAVGIISNHTTWKGAPEGPSPAPDYVLESGKPIWDTEEHVYQDGFAGAIGKVKACNENYLDNKVTSTVFWHLVSAFYGIEGWYGKHAMAIASSPWSGDYALMPELWAHAHTCQFTQIGWRFLDGGSSGYLAGGGSYVTYAAPNGSDYSTVIETRGAKAAQSLAFTIAGGLSAGAVAVWRSDATTMFQRQEDLAPQHGAFAITLAPNTICTLTTLTGQRHGAHPEPPPAKPFPFPYHEDYDHYRAIGGQPYYHADIQGVFEVAARADGGGRCLRSVIPFTGTKTALDAFTILGDARWQDYQVDVDASPTAGGVAALLGRVTATRGKSPKGYILTLAGDGAWTLLAAADVLASGTIAPTSRAWHHLALAFAGTTITASIDGQRVATATSDAFPAGMAGLGARTGTPCFDDLVIGTVGGMAPPPTVFAQDQAQR